MKKFLILILSLCLVGLVAMPVIAGDYTRFNAIEIKSTRGDKQEGRDVFRINDGTTTGTSMFRVDSSGNVWILDASGTTPWYFIRDRYVYIDSLSDLSTFSGAAAGSSYFQMEAGRTYVVDFEAIRSESKTATSGVTGSSWSAVTAMMPLATAANHRQDVTVMIACTGATGYATAAAGVTTVEVWPALLAGATRFGEPSVGNQNMTYHSSSSTPWYVGSSTNTYDQGINYLNESITWKLFFNSSVSAQIINQTLSQ